MKIWTVKKSEEEEREHKRDLFELIALIVLSQNKTKRKNFKKVLLFSSLAINVTLRGACVDF